MDRSQFGAVRLVMDSPIILLLLTATLRLRNHQRTLSRQPGRSGAASTWPAMTARDRWVEWILNGLIPLDS